MAEFLAMGGYGAYVWGAYGFALLALAANALAPWRRLRRLRRAAGREART